nr:defensin-like [Parasteatoda tepidariorum]
MFGVSGAEVMLPKILIIVCLTLALTTTKAARRNLCPTNWNECHELCRKQGRRGGYCAGAWSERCLCIMRSNTETTNISSNLAYSAWMRMMNNRGSGK